jgi:hypothetical protein
MTYEIDSHALSIPESGSTERKRRDMMTGQSHSYTNRLYHACWIFNETVSVALIIPHRNEITTSLHTLNT